MPAMLEQLQLRDFRCFAEVGLEFAGPMTLLTGRNGQGKTSLLEAACVLLRLQSPRTTTRKDWIRLGTSTAVVEGAMGGQRLRCAVAASARRLAVDEVVCQRPGDYLSRSGLVVWMDHGDMRMLRGGAEHRRRLLDFTASQIYPDYLAALRGYERALRGRNQVLKRDARIDWAQADAFARVLAERARVLRQRRTQLLERMAEPMFAFHERVSQTSAPIAAAYRAGFEEENLADELAQRREEEQRQRVTVCGPHRDDVGIELDGKDATRFASEGQQRTLALALRLAQARLLEEERGRPPLLLLDDVFGELDRERRRALLECLPAGAQKIVTTTHLDWLEQEGGDWVRWEVAEGGVRRV
ncbi:MAG: DNA replication and repair protein RecF [Verrucomicrobiales bacterium]|nr:DNA replication and repair protein RecF [Verrucomicrobiales bacterium]